MAKKEKEVKVEVVYTPGYEKRYTVACLRRLRLREIEKQRNESKIA